MGRVSSGPSGVECFAFLWGFQPAHASARQGPKAETTSAAESRRPCREEGCEQTSPQRLEDLEEACQRISRRRGKLAWRIAAVTARLLPVGCCCAADLLRRGGPQRATKNARRFRLALEALGPAFVKLGQAIAAREDVLSEPVAMELRKLCDQVPPFPCEDARRLLEEELGPLAPTLQGPPVAAASLGQVYRISVGTNDYAMKVQRPGLAEALAVDLVVLRGLASLTRRIVARVCTASLDPVQVVKAWSKTLWQELDYTKEADSIERMRGTLCRVEGLVIPEDSAKGRLLRGPLEGARWASLQSSMVRVLTTAWVPGVTVSKDPSLVQPQHVRVGVETYASMILDLGLVHADPHAGNMLVTPGNELCLLDFGMVIEIPPDHRTAWAQCLVNLVRRDHEATLDSLITIGFFPADCPRQKIMPVMSKIWTALVNCGSNTKKRKDAVRQCYEEIRTLALDFEFDLPDYYLALVRALLTLEGLALSADCDFDIFQVCFPVAVRLLAASAARGAQASAKQLCSRRSAGAAAALALLALGTAAAVAAKQVAGA